MAHDHVRHGELERIPQGVEDHATLCDCRLNVSTKLPPIKYCSMHAAAPELLALCKFAAGFIARHKRLDDGMNLHNDLLAAIAKAEGRR